MSTISLQLVCKYPFINRFHGESEAGGCILIVTNLPNAYVAESSVAGCIFSLIQNIFSLLFFDTVLRLKLAKRPLSNRRDQTHKKARCLLEKCNVWPCKNFGEAETNNWFTLCTVEREGGNISWRVVRAEWSFDCLWKWWGGFTASRDPARLFSPTVVWPTRARTPLLCVGYDRGRGVEVRNRHLS